MRKKHVFFALTLIGVSVLSSVATVLFVHKINQPATSGSAQALAIPTSFTAISSVPAIATDFTSAAEQTVHSVVHVKTKYRVQQNYHSVDPLLEFFFGRPDSGMGQPREQMASGSGVIISEDGYIVTNNHVIERASEVEITLNDKRTFIAKVIGADTSTDIALLKIEATDLQPIKSGNSDNLQVGEWVLAVGNPFNLTSTVTAGIVSAKARNINILNAEMKIESFIQTDAAVNPGNSGGALVNTNGELVGINTAIASQTGSYAGYAFAVPISIVSKVIADLKEFGVVQRAVLGVTIQDIDNKLAEEKKLGTLSGAYVAGISENSSAKAAGIKEGDVINDVNGISVTSVAQLQEQIGRYRPGDKISIGLLRNGKSQSVTVQLKNRSGNTDVVKAVDLMALGAKFEPLSDQLKYRLRLSAGVQVTEVTKNGLFAAAGISKGFIILKINGQTIRSHEDIDSAYSAALSGEGDDAPVLFISGVYLQGKVAHYAVSLK
ncbi:MAG: Do family serine endopeptidase [Prevotellaceae bacterium]|nr:Do family serine endopeptidase [Prevotellaceae bacterium]